MNKKIVIGASVLLVAVLILVFVTLLGITDWTSPQLSDISLTAMGQDDEQLARNLMTAYLGAYRSLLVPYPQKLRDFTVDEIHTITRSGDTFSFSISYSVRPAEDSSNWWIAGNGRTGDDGWIEDKFAFVTAKRQGDNYTLYSIGTGP